MKALSVLDEVVRDLEQHENAARIKKLIFSACRNTWENEPSVLQSFRLHDLLQELHSLNPTLEHLKSTLDALVQTLNKKAEYLAIANIIIGKLEKLYLQPQELTQQLVPNISAKPPQQPSNLEERKRQYNKFDVRLEVMRYTIPMRAKMLVFSTLHHQFDFSHQDWLTIKSYQLDDLLLNLFRSCESVAELESKLYNMAKCLENPDENEQAAGAIVQAMKRFYNFDRSSPNQAIDREPAVQQNRLNLDEEDENTCQVSPFSTLVGKDNLKHK